MSSWHGRNTKKAGLTFLVIRAAYSVQALLSIWPSRDLYCQFGTHAYSTGNMYLWTIYLINYKQTPKADCGLGQF